MLFNSMFAAEIPGKSRKVNALQNMADKLPYSIICKSIVLIR